MWDLRGKAAVVTGGSSGIGRAIASSLAKEGCRIGLLARDRDRLDDSVAEITDVHDVPAYGCSVDLLDGVALRNSFRDITRELGPVEILVNNAGLGTFKPMDEMSEVEVERPVQLPFGAALAASHLAIPGMLKRRSGHIINLTSPSGFMPLPYMAPYTASRHAMVGLSYSLYEELHPMGVGVSLICPAQVNTGYFDLNDADIRWWPRISSLFRVLEPAEVGERTVDAIKRDKREVIFPLSLRLAVGAFRRMPRVSIALCKALGLWGPSRARST